ncbi:MFS transporter [Roseibium aggregatum]|nr:MFS transporter [Roseibium aggregatum]
MDGSAGPRALAAYSLMAFPLAFAGLPIYLNAPDFYAVVLQQPLAALGSILLALRLIDALQDPLIGDLSDRFHEQRTWILGAGTILLGVGFWMLFHPLNAYPLLWFAASVLICTTGFSIVSINFQALGGLWRVQARERTRITASREAFGLLGLLTAAILPQLLIRFGDTAAAFHWLTLAYLPLLAAAYWVLTGWLKTAPLDRYPPDRSTLRWKLLFRSRWRRVFFGLLFLNGFASAIPAVLVLFFIRDRLGGEAYAGAFLLTYFLAGVLSMPLWTLFARALGKLRAWQLSMGLAIATFFWAAFLQEGDFLLYGLVCAFSGLALGADLALPPAILADHIEDDGRQGETARLFSVMTLLSKSALAVATGLALPLLALFGYQPAAPMTAGVALSLSLIYAGLPCLLKTVALCTFLCLEKDLATPEPRV